MAKNTGLGKGLDALFSDKTVIEDIKKEEELLKQYQDFKKYHLDKMFC